MRDHPLFVFWQSRLLRETVLDDPLPGRIRFSAWGNPLHDNAVWVVMSETCAGLSSGREAAEEIDARVGLDECDLDAVERSRVGEDSSALREIERLWGKELHSLRGQSNDVLFEIGDLQCKVVNAFASSVDELGY